MNSNQFWKRWQCYKVHFVITTSIWVTTIDGSSLRMGNGHNTGELAPDNYISSLTGIVLKVSEERRNREFFEMFRDTSALVYKLA